jgi:hypothetical protein
LAHAEHLLGGGRQGGLDGGHELFFVDALGVLDLAHHQR